MALEIIDKKIVGTIDSLEAKLSGNIPIQIEELLLLINSWGRENSFYTCHLNQDMKIDKCEATQSEQAKLVRKKDKVNKIQEITEELMDKTSKDLKEASTIHKPDMKDHSKDKFNMKLLVNQKLAIPLYDSEDKISKKMAKPNAQVPVSNVNYGNFSKVIISKKVYLIENKYIVQ